MHCTCLFVYLDGCLVAIDPNDFTDKLVMANFYLRHILANHDFLRDRQVSRTNSYMATPIMSSATTTGL